MVNKLKPAFTLFSIGLFILFAVASFGPDNSTNTEIAINECLDKPEVSGILYVIIYHKDKSGAPIPFANGRLYIAHQKVLNPNVDCHYTVVPNQVDFITDIDGKYTYSIPFTHNCDKDLNRIQLAFDKTSSFTAVNQVKVAYYATTSIIFNAISQKLDDL